VENNLHLAVVSSDMQLVQAKKKEIIITDLAMISGKNNDYFSSHVFFMPLQQVHTRRKLGRPRRLLADAHPLAQHQHPRVGMQSNVLVDMVALTVQAQWLRRKQQQQMPPKSQQQRCRLASPQLFLAHSPPTPRQQKLPPAAATAIRRVSCTAVICQDYMQYVAAHTVTLQHTSCVLAIASQGESASLVVCALGADDLGVKLVCSLEAGAGEEYWGGVLISLGAETL
jgi:hypothetical protein